MASTQDFVDFVCEQISGQWDINYKKMFGQYMVYANAKPIILVCDNTVYVKMKEEITELMQDSDRAIPYKGAKEHYILDIENKELSTDVITILEQITPLPKPRKPKNKTVK